ncbi:uncharacterized protein [Temnothorax nylanderi]|uniref:uncharacterized protein n=1 Tax=Temnothorax nylanderi TaxID=102681 RepID=UPI003A8C01BC
MLRDIITYLGGGSAEKKINDSHDVSQSMYIDLLPIPPEHAKSSLQKGSGVHITKAAQSRIILEAAAACHQNVSGKRKRKADALLGPKTMIRHALIEMFGRAQLAEASACGSHGKKLFGSTFCKHCIILSHKTP